jgi:SH3-like domain-containing protein
MTVLTGNQIDDARRLTLRQMLKLEIKGLSKSRGPSAYSTLKSVYGYKGSREKVLSELDAWRNDLLGESK